MRKLLLFLAAFLALAAPLCYAQVNVVPQVGVNTANLRQNTYGAISIGLVPASAATDIFCISGSATKTVAVHSITVSGTAGTAITTPIVVLRRASLDTGGTLATSTALPVAGKYDTNNPAATAVLAAYTANPTINDSSPTYLEAEAYPFLVTTGGQTPFEITAGTQADMYDQGFHLRGVAQQLCLNLNGATITSPILALSIEWVEF